MPIVFMTEAQRVRNKAVKVLKSVRNRRQVDVAESYSDRAMKFFKDRGELGMYKDLQIARIEMYGRLDKPRYTLKDGEWVRKTATQKMVQKFSKEFDAHRAGAVLSMASRHIPSFDPCQTSGRC